MSRIMIPDSSPQGNPSPIMETPTIEQLIAEAAARGALAQQEEEARIAASLAEHAEKEARKKSDWYFSLQLPGWTYSYAEVTTGGLGLNNRAKLTLPGCVPILINDRNQASCADQIRVEFDQDEGHYVTYDYVDWSSLKEFDRIIYEATQLYPAWQAAKAECERLNAAAAQPKPEPKPEPKPSTLDTATDLLQRFVDGATLVDYPSNDDDLIHADTRAALIAAQLLAIAQAVSRIADALEDR